jgi:hypothetical protein
MNRCHPIALIAALVIVLAGCTDDTPPPADSSPTISATGSASAPSSSTPTASASSTLAADEQQAFDDATDAVVAYNQTWVDLYTGARTNLNDLHTVLAEGDLLDASLKKAQQDLDAGAYATPKGAQIALVSSEPVSVKLSKEPPTVVLKACVDSTAVTTFESKGSKPEPGVREEVTYTVVQTTYLPDPGWAVQKMEGPADPEKRRC